MESSVQTEVLKVNTTASYFCLETGWAEPRKQILSNKRRELLPLGQNLAAVAAWRFQVAATERPIIY